jgi:hypothetical protein
LVPAEGGNSHRWTVYVQIKKLGKEVHKALSKLETESISSIKQLINYDIKTNSNDTNGGLDVMEIKENDVIKKVTFKLHPTFTPMSVSRENAPFRLVRLGWGTFNVRMNVEFHNYLGLPNVMLDHMLSFERPDTQNFKLINFDIAKILEYKEMKNKQNGGMEEEDNSDD